MFLKIKNRKLEAFTILELIVVMLLSAIIFGLAYQAFYIIQSNYTNFSNNGARLLNTEKLYYQLMRDIDEAETVKAEVDILICYSREKQVSYRFEEEMVVREQNTLSDTFFCSINSWKWYYKDQQVISLNTVVDRITFTSNINEEEILFDCRKTYGADVRIELEAKLIEL